MVKNIPIGTPISVKIDVSKNVFESNYWQIIFSIIDFYLNILFLFFKLINPKYIKYLLHKLTQNIYKLFVNIVKSNKNIKKGIR